MKRIHILTIFLSMFVLFSFAQRKGTKAAPATWSEMAVSLRTEAMSKLKSNNFPVSTGVVKSKQAAIPFSADVTGVEDLVLITYGSKDGSEWDHGVWADGVLIAEDGSKVSLNDMKTSFETAGWGTVLRNKNTGNKPVTINGQKFKNTLLCHAHGEIIIPLNKRFKRFECFVGIDDLSPTGTVIFKAQNINGRAQAKLLESKFPNETALFVANAGCSTAMWMSSKETEIEEAVLQSLIKKLANKDYYLAQLNKLNQESYSAQKGVKLLNLYQQLSELVALQAQMEWLNPQAIQLAVNDMKKLKNFNVAANQTKLNELNALVKAGFDNMYHNDAQAVTAAKRALQLKREILLANPLLDMDKIIVGRYKLGSGARSVNAPSLGTQANNWSNQTSTSRTGFDAQIVELSNLRGNITSKTIFKPTNGSSVPDITLHWNADRIMFSMTDENQKWQVYQVNIDGSNLKKMVDVDEPDLEFFDAAYLPDNKIMAVSNIGYNGVPCVDGSDEVGNLCLYDPAKKNLRRLTFDQDANWGPVVMNNGKVMYTRWEYTDLTHYFSRRVMHMNPDGTEQKALYGSGGYFPNSTFDIKPIPGYGSRFIGIISGHHGVARSGRLILFDPAKGRKSELGMVQELPFKDRKIIPEIKDELVNGVWPQFIKPFPLNNEYYFVTAKLDPNSLWGLYLVDVFDNLTLIAEFEGEGLIHATPVVKQKTPQVIPDKTKQDSKESTVFIQDIYEGEGLKGVPRGTVKELRVFTYEYAYNRSPSNHWAQGIQSGWDIKRSLGTVPVEADGSVIFKVPANTPISLQPLDSKGRAIQWMRSWLTGMPGEVVSCVGCHEDQNSNPIPKKVIASNLAPHNLTVPEGGVRPYTFELEIQPVLDRNCVSCHNGKDSKPDFTAGRIDEFTKFSKSYLNFHPYFYRQGPEAEIETLKPYEYHASVSDMVRMLEKGHHGVKMSDKDWGAFYNWIDFNAPYHSQFFDVCKMNGFDQVARRAELTKKYAKVEVDWQKELRDYADYLKTNISTERVAPAKAGKEPKQIKPSLKIYEKDSQIQRKSVEIAPGIKMNFVRIPAGEFTVQESGNAKKQKIAKAFWMSETEISNEQFKSIFPKHDSRFIGQLWKDHTGPGYPANLPEQSAIRMSWKESQNFCDVVSKKTGLSVALPTESQWEWACRAGALTDFWYGDSSVDFAQYENLADKQLNKMAVSGVNPQPMSEKSNWYKYYTYFPKNNAVDDGNMLLTKGASYQANPFGLYDMHGNVAEWTRSDDPETVVSGNKENAELKKIVKGGSWIDVQKHSTASYTRSYYPWQQIYNVGFRVILED